MTTIPASPLLARPQPDRHLPPAPLVVICGGTGTAGFARALAQRLAPVTFLVNAYDDGLSTGRIRRHLGTIGPSDPAKLLASLATPDLAAPLRLRLECTGPAECWSAVHAAIAAAPLEPATRTYLDDCTGAFIDAIAAGGPGFDWADLALRNVILTGAAFLEGGFQPALDRLAGLFDLPGRIVVAHDSPDALIGVDTAGLIAADEYCVSYGATRRPLVRTHIVGRHPTPAECARMECPGDPDRTSAAIDALLPPGGPPAPAATALLAGCRGVVYAPGTLFSSILPTAALLRTELAAAGAVPKVLVCNLVEESEALTGTGVLHAFWRSVAPPSAPPLQTSDQLRPWVTTMVVDHGSVCLASAALTGARLSAGRRLPVDVRSARRFVALTVADLADRSDPGRHDGPALISALRVLAGAPA